jgi:pentatricopeptide repeat protein
MPTAQKELSHDVMAHFAGCHLTHLCSLRTQDLLGEMMGFGLLPDGRHYDVLLEAYAHHAQPDKALQVWHGMRGMWPSRASGCF